MQAEDPQAWVLVLALPPTHCVTLGKSHKPPKSQFPHVPNKGCGPCNPSPQAQVGAPPGGQPFQASICPGSTLGWMDGPSSGHWDSI